MKLRAWRAALCAGMVGLVGCGGDAGEGQNGDSPRASGSGASGSGASGSGGAGTTSGGQGQGGDPFELATSIGSSGTTGNGSSSEGCEHVDVVFALDNSSSMNEEKDSMRNVVFPAFAQALLDVRTIKDFRAAVIDACPTPANFHTRGAEGECSFQSGQSWMESSSSALTSEFQCVANLYADDVQCSGNSDDEQPASAVAAALEAGENAGFLRDDALLVVVAITDEDEQPVPRQSPQQIHDRLVAAKGDAKNVVFLGIGGKTDCRGVYGDADEADTLQRLVETFAADGRGFFWDLCAGRLEDGLTNALTAIETACKEFVPPPT